MGDVDPILNLTIIPTKEHNEGICKKMLSEPDKEMAFL